MIKIRTIFLFFIICLSPILQAEQNSLRWAADTESGYPFVFFDPQDQSKMMGFEYDLVVEIAKRLRRPEQFVQNAWDGLIPGLGRQQYDIVINGVEITEDRKKEVLFSEPYFITYEQLVVRADENQIRDLNSCKTKKVGTLKLSVAERILQADPEIQVLSYEAESNAFEDLRNQRLDAVLLDAPIAQYYAKPDSQLKLVGEPIGEISYGIALRKEDMSLKLEIDRILAELKASGQLREIYQTWSLWNPLMAKQFNDLNQVEVAAANYEYIMNIGNHSKSLKERLGLYVDLLPILGQGALVTLQISLVAMILAMLWGLCLTLMQLYGPRPLAWLTVLYIEVIRGTPLLIQLFFIYYALPHIGIKLTPWLAAVLGLGLNYATSEAENYRAGIQAIPKAQTEAAYALGLNTLQTIRHIILPQATRLVIPPVTNDFIALLKDSSLVSAITMVELTKLYGQLASTYYDYIGIGILVAIFYLLIGLPFVRLARYFEKKLRSSEAVTQQRRRA